MKKLIFFILLFFPFLTSFAQNFTGQWKGSFLDKSSSYGNYAGDQCDYVLELGVSGNKINGSSYTYFNEGGIKYYTICKLEGSYNKKSKTLEVKETARLKTNIPRHIRNCFQIHRLTYFKQNDQETMEGDWLPAPKQEGSCGFGTTKLSRRKLTPVYTDIAKNKKTEIKSHSGYTNNNKTGNEPIQRKPTFGPKVNSTQPGISSGAGDLTTNNTGKNENNGSTSDKNPVNEYITIDPRLEKRKNNVLKTIEVESSVIKVDLYDNGEIDGDSITLYFNGKQLLANKKLTDKAITFNLKIDNDDQSNELVMFAENLGTIAPNTALMVVTDGPNRYEVRITSDLEKSGLIRFVHKSAKK